MKLTFAAVWPLGAVAERAALASGVEVACEKPEVDEADACVSDIDTDIIFSITVGAIFSLPLQRIVEARQLSHVWHLCRKRFLNQQQYALRGCEKREKIALPCRVATFPNRYGAKPDAGLETKAPV